MDQLAEAVVAGAGADQLLREPLPTEYRAVHIRRADQGMFNGVADKDVRKSLHVGYVPMPELAPDEVLVAIMASSINYNTVWSAMFEPVSTFGALAKFAREGGYATRHNLDHQVVGSDGAGVVVRVGAGVRHWKVGDHVVLSPAYVDDQEPATHGDAMLGRNQLAWGYETNFGGLATYAVVRTAQVLPKPAHLTWEEAASITLCAGTAYRMLVGEHGARIKQGDIALIWGATGGLGAFAVQMVKNGGGIAIGVVSSPEKANLARALGCDLVIDRSELEIDHTADTATRSLQLGKQLGKIIRARIGEDPHVAFDCIGQATFGASVFVIRRGGVVVTCGSSSGYQHQFDNRYLWMNLKRIIGSHVANLQEQFECNRLFALGKLTPVLSRTYELTDAPDAARLVQENGHIGKVGVLGLAPSEGLGITDPTVRAAVGEERMNLFQNLSVS